MSSIKKLDLYDQKAEARLTEPTQTKVGETASTWFAMRRDPLVLEGAFLEVIRTAYTIPENLLPHTKVWDPHGKEKGSPFIEVDSKWSDSDNNPYPMIIIEIEDLKYSTRGVQGLGDNAGENLQEGIIYQAREVHGAVKFNHISVSKPHVRAYQATTLDIVDSFSEPIRQELCFEKFDVTDIFKPRQRKDQPLEWEAGIVAKFRFQEFFGNKLESPKLKQMSVKLKNAIDQRFKMVE